MEFVFLEMVEKENTVIITTQNNGIIELSILQLAKVFNVDLDVLEEMEEESGFGSVNLEEKCDETRALVEKFPTIDIDEMQLHLSPIAYVKEFGIVIAEDIIGWSNEGIRVKTDEEFECAGIEMIISPKKLILQASSRVQ